MQRILYRWEDRLYYRGARRLTICDAWCNNLSHLFGRLGDTLSAGP